MLDPAFLSAYEHTPAVSEWASLISLTVITAGLSTFWHNHNCHNHHCLRLSWHPDKDGHPVCKVHHPDHPARSLWWEIKHFFKTGEFGDHSHPNHTSHDSSEDD